MDRTPVNSAMLKSVGHEGTTLHVEFRSGVVYAYDDVSRDEFEALLSAKSPGKCFNERFRSRVATKVASKDAEAES